MQNLGQLSEGLLLSKKECVNVLCKRNYATPSRRHLEPRDLSWQWAVRSGPEAGKCKDLCVPKICPKKRFFPRFKKSYVPAEKKSCSSPKKKQSWKEYLSFLLPDPVAKPPLATCRKLQARRRECCGNPFDCGAYCLRDNCCPVAKEWYGQAVVYDVPSGFPQPAEPHEPTPCAPPPPTLPVCSLPQQGVCPQHTKELNMDDYAYKKAFSGINVCDDIKSKPQKFKCSNLCIKEPDKQYKQQKLTCGFSTEFKEVECPQPLPPSEIPDDLPPLVCKTAQASKPPEKEVLVEEKKGVCERTTFLKPYRYGEKYPGMGFRSYCTLRNSFSHQASTTQRSRYSTGPSKLSSVPEPTIASLSESFWVGRELPAFVQRMSFYQPSKSSISFQSVLSRPAEAIVNYEVPYASQERFHSRHFASKDQLDRYDPPDIDPKLLALAEEVRRKTKSSDSQQTEGKKEKSEPRLSLAKKLSNEVTQRLIKRSKEGVEKNSPTRKVPLSPLGKTKLCLLKSKSPMDYVSRATITTDTCALRKNRKDESKKKKIICSGCSGIKEAEREAVNPTPKSFLDCKVRPAGRCQGPARQPKPGEPEPDNPYYKNKAKPYSMCNQPRPCVKKEERPYKMPCEDSQKRKFHTSCLTSESAPSFTTISDFMKSKGLSLNTKYPNIRANAWDSHTPDSYQERETKGYDSMPDLAKFSNEDMKPFKTAFTGVSSGKHQHNVRKMGPKADSFSFENPNPKMEDWGYSPGSDLDSDRTDFPSRQEPVRAEVDKNQSMSSGIKPDPCAINIWEPYGTSHSKSESHLGLKSEKAKDGINRINISKSEFKKNSQDYRLQTSAFWSSTSADRLSQGSNTSSQDRATRLSVLFNSADKDKQRTNENDTTKGENYSRFFMNQTEID